MIIRIIVSLVLFLSVCSGLARAGQTELKIALGNFRPLFSGPGESALFKDLIEGVYAYIPSKTISYRYMLSNARLVVELNENTVDGAANIFSPGEIKGCISQPVFRYSDVAITRKDRGLKINSVADLKDVSVVTYQRARTLLGKEFNAVVSGNEFYQEVPQPKEQARLLATGMVDVSIGDKYIFLHSLKTWSKGHYDVNEFVIHPIFPDVYTYMGFNRQELCDEFDLALALFKASGRYEEIFTEHLFALGYRH
ncbi:transporter substrate-binding domain-containing protein [Thalassomonas viridans]|uniref:Transporter substrate-binding domain-containing protein n=1 Tax=Thalassomonas viridans TaxID=137584 RepID=A0AAF0C9L5_9GAMM|nr:transporter substrate-binding domain-containing protein [Thalassomonas viridans]WDE05908.1 transporter substrate-binding domain-containing protein [Thalassomonas viridans]